MELEEAIKRARETLNDATVDESEVKQYVIMPLLLSLGWDVYNRNEIRPEYRTSGGIVDYAIFLNRRPVVFLEVKNPSHSLFAHQEQLLRYSYNEGVRLACLTNGKDWWFFLPLEEGPWEKRKFLEVNIDENGFEKFLSEILSKGSISSGEAFKKAKSLLYTIVHLPNALIEIMREPDELLVDLLKERFYEEYKIDVDDNHIISFLRTVCFQFEHYRKRFEDNRDDINGIYHKKQIHQGGLSSEYISKKKKYREFILEYNVEEYIKMEFKTINELTIFLFKKLESVYPGFYERFYMIKHGRKRKYISKNIYELYGDRFDLSQSQSKPLSKGWYIGTNYSVRDFRKMITYACNILRLKCSYDENDHILIVQVSH